MLLNKRISIWEFIRQVGLAVVWICAYAVVIGFLDGHRWFAKIVIPLGVTAVVGTALSLLLAFRTSQSYERWWEARVVWGAIVNDSRTLIRQAQLYLPAEAADELKSLAQRQIIWNYALGEALRRLPHSERVQTYLTKHGVTGDVNVPAGLLNAHSRQLKNWKDAGLLTEFGLIQIDSTLARLCDSMGKCERIKNTVFPRNYSLLIHSLIYVFATMLPFGLDDNYVLVEILLTAALPIIFIAIEKTAILMQDPFENLPIDTPMTALATTIEINILQTLGQDDQPAPLPQDNYFIM